MDDLRSLPEDLHAASLGWARLWQVRGLLRKVSLRRNSRLKSTVARWVQKAQCVELGPRFFALRSRQAEILCHELAHAAVVLKYGPGVSPHGPEWRALVEVAGFTSVARIKSRRRGRRQTPRAASPIAYEHRCPVCHAVRYAKRTMIGWRCVECVGIGLAGQLQISKVQERA